MQNLEKPDRLVRTPEAAALLGLSRSTLEKMRCRGDGPAFIKLGSRAVGYDPGVLRDWAKAGTRKSTSDARGEAST
jgi:predicted DNA-binding transcriptional regulator AlpA